MTESLLNHIFISKDDEQYLTLIENGVKNINKKCNQVSINSLLLANELESDINLQKTLKNSYVDEIYTPKITLIKGVCSWQDQSMENEIIHTNTIMDNLKEFGINFAIQLKKLPEFDKSRMYNTKHLLFKHSSNIENCHKEKFYKLINSSDESEIIAMLRKNPKDSKNHQHDALRGKFSEIVLMYIINDYVKDSKVNKELQLFYNFSIGQKFIQYSNQKFSSKKLYYNKQNETDVLMSYSKKDILNNFLINLRYNEYADIYINDFQNTVKINYDD